MVCFFPLIEGKSTTLFAQTRAQTSSCKVCTQRRSLKMKILSDISRRVLKHKPPPDDLRLLQVQFCDVKAENTLGQDKDSTGVRFVSGLKTSYTGPCALGCVLFSFFLNHPRRYLSGFPGDRPWKESFDEAWLTHTNSLTQPPQLHKDVEVRRKKSNHSWGWVSPAVFRRHAPWAQVEKKKKRRIENDLPNALYSLHGLDPPGISSFGSIWATWIYV